MTVLILYYVVCILVTLGDFAYLKNELMWYEIAARILLSPIIIPMFIGSGMRKIFNDLP